MSLESTQLTNDEWAISKRTLMGQTRRIPHIYWNPHFHRWMLLYTHGDTYTRNDCGAQEYINRLNVTKQAHPIK